MMPRRGLRGVCATLACWWCLAASAAGQPASLPAEEAVAWRHPWIRVAIVRNQPKVDLTIRGRFRIVALHTADLLREGSRLGRVEVRASSTGLLVGGQDVPLFGVRVEPVRSATISLNGQRLRGTLEIVRQSDLSLLVINHLDLEDYLQGVLSKEAPFYWPAEALRAVAISARTYALFQRLSKSSDTDYDVTSDVLSQVYGGKTAERRTTSLAVRDTRGLILTYQGKLFPTFYHSTCGGTAEDVSVMGRFDVPPLKGGRRCSFCAESPFYRWQRRLTAADIAWAVKQQGKGSIWPATGLEIVSLSPTGRAAQVRIRGATTLTLTGYEFRQLFGFASLRSTAFSVTPQDGAFVLEGRGWGHGVGLCQWGAAGLAQRGLSAREVLAFYYPGAEIVRLGDVAVSPIPVQEGS